MRGIELTTARATAVALFLATAPAAAQTTQGGGTWSLPEPTTTATPRTQGPVDAQNPVVRSTTAAPPVVIPTPVPTITAAPAQTRPSTGTAPATGTAVPRPIPTRPAPSAVSPVETPRPAATASQRPDAVTPPATQDAGSPAPQPTASSTASATPLPAAPPTTSPPEPASTPAPEDTASGWPVWYWAAPLFLLALLAGVLALHRRRAKDEDEEQVQTVPATAERALEPVPAPTAPPAAPPAPPRPAPAPAAAPAASAAELAFEAVGMRLSLVYATLQYRLTITASQDLPAGHLVGDMIGAHGSIAPEDQLAPAVEALTPLKPMPALAAGESTTLTGEIQLPLSAIRPVRQANASLFVPLVRICVLAGDVALRRVFTVGQTGGEALAPLRLDTGPREHRELGAREVEAARAYPVRPPALQRAG